MREMKSSGLPWVGDIPRNWSVTKFKHIFSATSERNPGNVQVLSLYREHGIVPKDSRDDNHNVTSLDTSNYRYVQFGDFVVNKMKAWQGSTAVSDYEGIVSPAYYVFRFREENVSKRFYHYLLRSKAYAQQFAILSGGIRVGQWDLPFESLYNIGIVMPPFEEQSRIASFLDVHIAKIDDAITHYKALSDKLDEYRYNVISKITCIGIREKKLFTPLNNEFLDRLPKDWEYKRLKFTSVEIFKGDGITKEEVDVNGNIPCIRYGEIYSKYDIACSKCYSLTNLEAHTSPKYAVYGDLLFAGTGELIEDIGKNIVYLGSQPCLVGGDIIVVRHNQNPKFLSYALNSHYARAQKSKGKSKLKVVHISASEIGNIRVAIPPLDEQAEIVAYLDKKCSAIDSSKEKIEAVVKKLEEYKKSLIYNAVTGKIEC